LIGGALTGGAHGAAGGAVASQDEHKPSDRALMPERAIADHPDRHGRTMTMRNTLSIALTLLMLIVSVPLLGACHATAGAGEDISATGNALTNSAEKHTP
jgi:entericidin B